MDTSLIIQEFISRQKLGFDLEAFCFKQQLNFIRDPARFKTAVCSRRAGKTVACAAHLIHNAIHRRGSVGVYITLTRANAKRIIWPDLLKINRDYSLGGLVNETELSIRFPKFGDSIIYCSGAKDSSEIEKFRGMAISLAYLDESQGFRQYIRELVDDVISKALFDYNGALCLIGTPGPIPAGFFYECATSPDWSHHAWTMFDNPWLERKSGKKAMELIQEDLKRMGVTIDHPKIQRECFGKWVVDQNSLVFQYDRDRNHYDSLPARSQKWSYVIGVDVGFDDADAISVLAWHEHHPDVYLIHEEVQNQEGISALAARIKRLYDKYEPLAIVMDTGALGKKIADELTSRFSLPIQAAEKSRKLEHIELLNDAMRTGRFFAKRDSRFSQDCMLIEWDQDSTELKISDSYHSDIADSVLYAFRYCLQWLSTPEMIKPKANTPEWEEYQADEIERAIKSRLKEEQHPQSPWEGEW